MESASAFISASASIDQKIKELGDWRGKTLAKVRGIIHEADPEIVEEWKWVKPTSPGTPVFSHGGIAGGPPFRPVLAKGGALIPHLASSPGAWCRAAPFPALSNLTQSQPYPHARLRSG